MSEASCSSTKSASGRALGPDDLVTKLNERANVTPDTPFSLTSHLSAGRVLLALRDALLAGKGLSKRSKLTLICTGIALRRRHAASEVVVDADGPSADAAVLQDQETSRALLLESAQLIFTLLCMIERRENGDGGADEARAVVDHVNGLCLWDVLRPPRRKRSRDEGCADGEGEGGGEEGEGEEAASDRGISWREVMRIDVSEVAQHALRIGAARLTERQDDPELMALYFRSAAASMAAAMLLKSQTDFVSLGLNQGDVTVSREKKLLAIAQAAESEMGQSILRDLVLSFLLPASIIGVRRGLLLSRAASTEAGVDCPIAVARAHDVAYAVAPLNRSCGPSQSLFPNPTQDGGCRVHLDQRRGRAGAHVLPARGRGHFDDQGRRRPDTQTRGLWWTRVAALSRDHRCGEHGDALGARAQPAPVDSVQAERKGATQSAQLALKLSRLV